ncbi:probable ATP-dependent RNA helicase DHX34, partial [Paramuricea clavata]
MADEKCKDGFIDFDWKSHRETLDDVFFTYQDVIKRRSEQYKDFWQFLERYQQYQRRKGNSEQDGRDKKHGTKRKESSVLELPETFNKRYKFNISLATKDARTLKKLLRSKVDYRGTQRDESNSLTVNDLLEFKTIILYYLDFCQKQKFAKLQKLKSDQASLPISQFRDVIVQHVTDHQVVIVAGDTGCGKSTQIPQYLLSAGFSQISCTQPRRIACISLAKRVSYETLNEYGSDVAYQIRFETSKTRHTKILFLTE